MAEGMVNHFLGDTWEARSAGVHPAPRVHPLAVQAMAELGIDISAQRPKHLATFQGQPFDLVMTLCDEAAAECPLWLGGGRQVHIAFPDPAAASGSETEQLAVFRQVRDAIREQVLGYLRGIENPHSAAGVSPFL